MLETKLLFPCPFLVEAYRDDSVNVLLTFNNMLTFPNMMSAVDYMYAYMLAKKESEENKYAKEYVQYFEQKLKENPGLIEDAIEMLDSGVVVLWSVEDSSVDELTKEVIYSMRITANFFAKNGNSRFQKILLEKGVPLMAD